MGALARTPGESLEALEEAVTILRASWSDARSLASRDATTSSTARGWDPSRFTR